MTGTAIQSTKVYSGSHVRHVPTSQVEFGQLLPDFYMFDRQSLPDLPKQLDHTIGDGGETRNMDPSIGKKKIMFLFKQILGH